MGPCVFGNISVMIQRRVYSLLPFDNTQGTSQVEGAEHTHFLIIICDPDQFQTCIYTSINMHFLLNISRQVLCQVRLRCPLTL